MPNLVSLAKQIKKERRAADAGWVQHARAAGQLLIAAKKQLSHGEWEPYLRDQCDLGITTAQGYMRLARLRPQKAQRVAHLPLREALQTIATPKQAAQPPPVHSQSVFSDDRIVEAAFEHYRKSGFPYRRVPVHVAMQRLNQLSATSQSALLSSTVGYDVADSYHPHRFHATGGSHLSPAKGFERDDLLRRALRKALEQGQPIPAGYFSGLTIVSGVQPCSNFRPGIALHYYRQFCKPGATVLDTSAGYGGRLVGFLAFGSGHYIGIDPNHETHCGNTRLAADLASAGAVELHCLPAEDFDLEVVRGRCDFALTSPPYFTKERYANDPTQSWVRYPAPDAWRDGFLRPMLRLQFEALKPGAVSVINIDDVRIKNTTHALTEWTKALAADVGFELIGEERLRLPAAYWAIVHGTDATEPIFIFKKP